MSEDNRTPEAEATCKDMQKYCAEAPPEILKQIVEGTDLSKEQKIDFLSDRFQGQIAFVHESIMELKSIVYDKGNETDKTIWRAIAGTVNSLSTLHIILRMLTKETVAIKVGDVEKKYNHKPGTTIP